ncbi:MAG: CHAT domain-containing protein [Desulfobacterales bacterium]|nr:CHAT domain-containing protein [Desulfobacterales bacterium]
MARWSEQRAPGDAAAGADDRRSDARPAGRSRRRRGAGQHAARRRRQRRTARRARPPRATRTAARRSARDATTCCTSPGTASSTPTTRAAAAWSAPSSEVLRGADVARPRRPAGAGVLQRVRGGARAPAASRTGAPAACSRSGARPASPRHSSSGGVANFLGTHWPVGDQAAFAFSTRFYERLLDGDVARRLRARRAPTRARARLDRLGRLRAVRQPGLHRWFEPTTTDPFRVRRALSAPRFPMVDITNRDVRHTGRSPPFWRIPPAATGAWAAQATSKAEREPAARR